MPKPVSAAMPVLLSVTCCAPLVLPMFCRAKVSVDGTMDTAGMAMKLAVTDLATSMVTMQVGAVPALAHAPPQELKLTMGVALRVTTSPG